MGESLRGLTRKWLSRAQEREREKLIEQDQRERAVRALEQLAQKS